MGEAVDGASALAEVRAAQPDVVLDKPLTGNGLQFRVLGPFQVLRDGRLVGPAGLKRRGLLSMLVLRGNRTVPASDLIDGLWAAQPPKSATNLVQTYVSAWREALEPDRTDR